MQVSITNLAGYAIPLPFAPYSLPVGASGQALTLPDAFQVELNALRARGLISYTVTVFATDAAVQGKAGRRMVTAPYAVQPTDAGSIIEAVFAADGLISLPANGARGQSVQIDVAGAGNVQVIAAQGATVRSASGNTKSSAQWQQLTAYCRDNVGGNAAEWALSGATAAGAAITLGSIGPASVSALTGLTPGSVISTLTGKTPGSVLSISPNDGRVVLSADQTMLLAGMTASSIGSQAYTITETLTGATGSPGTSTVTVTTASPVQASSGAAPRLLAPMNALQGVNITQSGTSNPQFMITRTLTARGGTKLDTRARLMGGYIDNNGVFQNNGAAFRARMSLEYPVGTTPTQFTYQGASDIIVPDGQIIETDQMAVIPPDGATFKLHIFFDSSAGNNKFPLGRAVTSGGSWGLRVTGQNGSPAVDKTGVIGGETQAFGSAGYNGTVPSVLFLGGAPAAGNTTPAVAILGDSIGYGYNEHIPWTSDGGMRIGPWERWLGLQSIPGVQVSHSSVAANQYVSTLINAASGTPMAAIRQLMIDSCTHVINAMGRNDLGVRTYAQLRADIETINGYFAGKGRPVVMSTIPPRTASTDSWATLANQTKETANPDRVSFNQLARAKGFANQSDVLDFCSYCEDTQDLGFWKVNGSANAYTSDGIHPYQLSNAAAASGFPAYTAVLH